MDLYQNDHFGSAFSCWMFNLLTRVFTSQVTGSRLPPSGLFTSPTFRRRTPSQHTAASQDISTAARHAKAMGPGSPWWVSSWVFVVAHLTFVFILANKTTQFLPFRPQRVLTHHPGQFSSRGGVCGSEHRAPLHSRRLPQSHCALAQRWPPAALGRPLDTASDRADHQRPEAGGQRQLRVRGHQQFWFKGGVWTASCYRCAHTYTQPERLPHCQCISSVHTHISSAFGWRPLKSVCSKNVCKLYDAPSYQVSIRETGQ